MEPKKVVRKKKSIKKHIVIFQDHQGNVLKTEFVPDGGNVEAPAMEKILMEKKHHKIVFDGWDQNLNEVYSNLVIKPVYKKVPKTYLIMYFHENGKILGTETVVYGEDAKIPFHPEKEENDEFRYVFDGWSCNLTKIDSDRMAKARFTSERKQYPVRFYGPEGELLKQEFICYKEEAHAPESVEKPADRTYRYHFAGWDRSFSEIIGATEVHSVFKEEYIDYTVRFFEGKNCVKEQFYHYNDPIEYPALHKKGYHFIWKDPVEYVHDSIDLYGDWYFSNKKSTVIERAEGSYEIINPSITEGSVRCLKYISSEKIVKMPERVKLGDYSYSIEMVGHHAFRDCTNATKVICPDSVKILEEGCFSQVKHLQQVKLGKGIRKIGKGIFAGCSHLEKIYIDSPRNIVLHKKAFSGMKERVVLVVPSKFESKYKKVFADVIREKGVKIEIDY